MRRVILGSLPRAAAVVGAVLFGSGAVPAPGQNAVAPAAQRLAILAQRDGRVRVIVGVNVPFTLEGELREAAETLAQRNAIAGAQARVLSRVRADLSRTARRFETIPYVALEVDVAALDVLQRSPDVTGLEEDVPVPLALAQSTPLVGAPALWSQNITGAGWTVAVLDTGVDNAHPFLQNKVVSEACYSSNVAGQSVTVCPGGVSSSTAPGSGVPCAYSGCAHGTHVAGIAAGKGATFSGVAKDASLIAMQVFSYFASSNAVMAWTSDIIAGLERVAALKDSFSIAAVNLSLGGGRYTSLSACDSANVAIKAIVDQLRSLNIATVVASGNDGYADSLSSPACISSAVSVGSTSDGGSGPADSISSFSNSASFLSLLAPGSVILSSVPNGLFANYAGTSMATPHVAGAWALLRSARPSATVSDILTALQVSGAPITDSRNGLTRPRIRLDAALSIVDLPTTPRGLRIVRD